jgi:hypothetical protein
MIDFKTASRKDIKKFIHKVQGILYMDKIGKDKFTFAYNMKENPSLLRISNVLKKISPLLDRVDGDHIPFDWVSSKQSPEKPEFWDDKTLSSYKYNYLNKRRDLSKGALSPNRIVTIYFINNKYEKDEKGLREKIISMGNEKNHNSPQ